MSINKNFEDNRFRLVQKSVANKKERINVNQNLKDIARNPSAYVSEDEENDDSDFFNYEENLESC